MEKPEIIGFDVAACIAEPPMAAGFFGTSWPQVAAAIAACGAIWAAPYGLM